MPRNKLTDLNNHLFEQQERLNDPSLSGEKLDEEIKRAASMSDVAARIIDSAKTSVFAAKVLSNSNLVKEDLPQIFESKQIENK